MRELLIVIEPAPVASRSGQNRRLSRYEAAAQDAVDLSVGAASCLKALDRRPKPKWSQAAVSIAWYAKRGPLPDVFNRTGILKAHLDGVFLALDLDDRIVTAVHFAEAGSYNRRPRVEIFLRGTP